MRKALIAVASALVLSLCMFGSAFADEVKYVNVIIGGKVIASLPYVNDEVVSSPYFMEVNGITYTGNSYNTVLMESNNKLYVMVNMLTEYSNGQSRNAESVGGYEIESDGKYGYEINAHNIRFINNARRSLDFDIDGRSFSVPYMSEFGVINKANMVVTDFEVPLNTDRDEIESLIDSYNASQSENSGSSASTDPEENSGSSASSDPSGEGGSGGSGTVEPQEGDDNGGSSSGGSGDNLTFTDIVASNVSNACNAAVGVISAVLPYALAVMGCVLVIMLAVTLFKRYVR